MGIQRMNSKSIVICPYTFHVLELLSHYIKKLWKDNLSKHTRAPLTGLYELMKANADGIAMGLLYERSEYDPAGLLRFLNNCRSNCIDFEELPSWLALIAGVHNKENITVLQMLSRSYVPQPIHGFYIDLNELNALLDS